MDEERAPAPALASPITIFLAIALALSLVAPARAASEERVDAGKPLHPHLLMIHGGAFLGDDPLFEPLTAVPAAEAGFVTHYLSYPLGDLPGAVRAARAEARVLRARYGEAVYAYGSSAGGVLAAILAGDGLVLAAVAKAPPSDLVSWQWPVAAFGADYHQRIKAGPRTLRRLSPMRRRARRPLLLVQGVRDEIVPPGMNEAFAAKFRRVHLWTVPGGHWTERLRPRVLAHSMEWLMRRADASQGGRTRAPGARLVDVTDKSAPMTSAGP